MRLVAKLNLLKKGLSTVLGYLVDCLFGDNFCSKREMQEVKKLTMSVYKIFTKCEAYMEDSPTGRSSKMRC